jgi:hypothetical protein
MQSGLYSSVVHTSSCSAITYTASRRQFGFQCTRIHNQVHFGGFSSELETTAHSIRKRYRVMHTHMSAQAPLAR